MVSASVLSVLKRRVHPELHGAIEDAADLGQTLGLNQVDLVFIAVALEEELNLQFKGQPEYRWRSVSDIESSVDANRG